MKTCDGLQGGDKLYRVLDGVLRVVTFFSKRTPAEGSKETAECVLTCKKGDGKPLGLHLFECPQDMYERTELQAWERYEKECCQAEASVAEALEEARRNVSRLQVEWERAIEEIGRLKAEADRGREGARTGVNGDP